MATARTAPNPTVTIRSAAPADAAAVADIYNHYIRDSVATFEEEPVTPGDMLARFETVHAASFSWLVAVQHDRVVGFAYAAPWKKRPSYRHSVEVTAYIAPDSTGQGIGSRLYEQLFAELADRGIHAVMGGISLPNDASIALHEKFGMQRVAHFREVGFKFGRWIDVAYWQRILVVLLCAMAVALPTVLPAQQPAEPPSREQILTAARSIIDTARLATLVTVGLDGHPQARIVDPFTPDSAFTIWVGTNRLTRKVQEIARESRVTLLYFNAAASEFVTVVGSATLVSDSTERGRRWKPEWAQFYEDGPLGDRYLLIRVTPVRLEVVSPQRGLLSDRDTWRPAQAEFP